MPFLGRDKPRTRSRRSDDEFVVFLQGIPPHCRWQELKDLVRQTALHIRQAVVYDDSHGFPTGLGQIIVKNEDEAWRTYHRLSTNGWDGQSLVVTLSRTSTPTKPIAGPTRSPSAIMHSGYIPGHSTPPVVNGTMAIPPSPVSPESVHSSPPSISYPDYGVMIAPAPMPLRSFIPMMPDPLAPPMQCFPPSPVMNGTIYEPHWNMMPGYSMSPPQHLYPPNGEIPIPNHHPYHPRKFRANGIDPNSPSFHPDRRGLTIENLNAATTCIDLRILLQKAGTVQQCSIFVPDSTNGQIRGLIAMQTAEEAQCAVTMFNNLTFMGSRIRVKIDRGAHIMRTGSFDRMSSGGSDTNSSVGSGVEGSGEMGQSWAEEMTVQAKPVNSCKPLVIDGSGLRRSVHNLSTSAPT
ncbi:Nucleotide-binding alpha-beta plait [Penicillium paradoxum]|uniref:Nucleotide-binding alpha-beta plait n=1 Tax=Penicillium paradoxum TaxID=176176 RepID=UPI002546A2F9|nr:Nucleotide-binding alpha-beta plait [Penicillium paradoxum]KAJ5787943.1 Nucleotide-binding alpha-beta plait [Penicillium paradoxum]